MEKNDWITQTFLTPKYKIEKIEFSISGMLGILDNKKTPLTPAEQVLHALLEQPTVDARASFNELWEFSQHNTLVEMSRTHMQWMQESFPELHIQELGEPIYDMGKKRVDDWVDAHDESLQEWFKRVRSQAQETASYGISRRNFLQRTVNLAGFFFSAPLMIGAFNDIASKGANVWNVARAATGTAGCGLSLVDDHLRHKAENDVARGELALGYLNGMLLHLDRYIFERMYQKHPEIFQIPPMQHLSR